MKFLKWTLALLALLVVLGFFLPDSLAIARSTVIAAEPGAVHARVAALETWPEWTVWNRRNDDSAVFTFSGSGVGSKWHWKGAKFGEGELEIVESDPLTGVRYTLTMTNGFKVDGDIALTRDPTGTRVTWTDKAKFGMGPLGGWMRLALAQALDREQGGNQEAGLAALKAEIEAK